MRLLDKRFVCAIILSMEEQVFSPDRFLPDRRIFRAAALVELTGMLVPILATLLILALVPHPDAHLVVFNCKITTWCAEATIRLSPVFFVSLIVALVYATHRRTINEALAALKTALDGRKRQFPFPIITTASQSTPAIHRDRVTVRERRSHRRAIHILTCRSAAKGDGHAAVALTYSFAANTA